MFRTLHLRLRSLGLLDGDARAFGLGYLVLLPLYLAPILVARFLPGLDLPFHLSMVDMLNKDGSPDSPYADFYRGTLGLAPYAAHYGALRLLSTVLPLMAAHKVIVAIYVAGFPLCTAALLNAAGRSRIPALLAFPLAYNLTLHYGFVSFALSLPVLMLLLAALTRFLLAPQMMLWLWAATALLAVLLFLCHLQNFLYGLCAAGAFVLFSGARWSRRGLAALAALPAVICLLYWHGSQDFAGPLAEQQKSFAFAWQSLKDARLADLPPNPPASYDLLERSRVLPLHLLRGFTDLEDARGARALLVVLGAYLALGILGAGTRGAGAPTPRMRIAGWVTVLGAAIAYYGLPHHLQAFELMTFYPRFSVLLVLTGVLLIPAGLRRLDGVGRFIVALPAVVMAGLYGEVLTRHYRLYDAEVADLDTVMKKTPPGGRAMGLIFDRTSRVMRIESALVGLANLYPALRPAPGSMVPLVYCNMRHIPCRFRDPMNAAIPEPGAWSPHALNAPAAIGFFDYLFIRLPPPGAPILGADISRLEILAQEGSWIVYRHKNGRPPAPKPVAAPAPPVKSGAAAGATPTDAASVTKAGAGTDGGRPGGKGKRPRRR